MKTIMTVLFLLLVSTWSFAGDGKTQKGEVGDSSGRLIYKTYTRGNVTETRQPSGKLVTKSKTKDGKTEVRSPSGKLLNGAK